MQNSAVACYRHFSVWGLHYLVNLGASAEVGAGRLGFSVASKCTLAS